MTIAAAIESRTARGASAVEASAASRASISSAISAEAEADLARARDAASSRRPISASICSRPGSAKSARAKAPSPSSSRAHDADGRPLVLLPLTLRTRNGVRIASFMGGKHANFNMALWDTDFAREATAADLDALLSGLRAKDAVDVLALTQQPRHWQDHLNPLAMLPQQPSVNDFPVLHHGPRRSARSTGSATRSAAA